MSARDYMVCYGMVQYQQPDKLIFNESTFKKLNAYLDMDFLKNIRGYLEP